WIWWLLPRTKLMFIFNLILLKHSIFSLPFWRYLLARQSLLNLTFIALLHHLRLHLLHLLINTNLLLLRLSPPPPPYEYKSPPPPVKSPPPP
ncbi:unnamed protein product, partial [Brassica napus]